MIFALTEKKKRVIKKYLFLVSIIGVQLAAFCVFYIGVNFNSLRLAFQGTSDTGKLFYGFHNFVLFFENAKNLPDIKIGFRNTLIFFVVGLLLILTSFLCSYFLFKKCFAHKLLRILFFLPSVLSAVVWSNIYRYFVGVDGPLAALAQMITGGAYPPNFLGENQYALIFVVIYSVWMGFAGNFILYLGTMTRIPVSIMEAGKIDGLGWFGELTRIVVPLVWPTLSTLLILSFTGIFMASGNILLLTNGEHNTTTLSFIIFQNIYNNGQVTSEGMYGYTAAIGIILTVCTLPIVLVTQKLLKIVDDVRY